MRQELVVWRTPKEAGAIIGVPENTIRKWVASGRLPHSRPFGKLIKIRDSVCQEQRQWLNEYTLDVKGAAKYLGCSTHSIYRALERIPHKRLGETMFKPADLDKFVADREVNAE